MNKVRIISLVVLVTLLFSAMGCTNTHHTITLDKKVSYEGYTSTSIDLESDVFKFSSKQNTALGISFGGIMGQRIENTMNRWMYTAYYSNPAMIEMFRQRESNLKPVIQAWYGEFPGKYLTSAAYMYAMNHDKNLKNVIDDLIDQLESIQSEEGYLGPWSEDNRIIGYIHDSLGGGKTWDLWGHYHIIRGLILWHKQTGSEQALEIAKKAADYIVDYFETSGKTLADVGESEKNLSIAHGFIMLYEVTGKQSYMDFANDCMDAWELVGNGDFYRKGIVDTPYYKLPTSRWEGFHCVLALAEMYHVTGINEYKDAFLNLWNSLKNYDRHNTGGATTGERAIGTPYQNGSIETCCTVAWASMTVEAAKLTGDPTIIDELELTTFNGILGAQSSSGRWFTYNTPMEGQRKASAHEIVFQAIPGSPELNCCSVNGPVGLGLISQWAVFSNNEYVALNYYGESDIATLTPSGGKLVIKQETNYPAEGEIRITLLMEKEETFDMKLRIPMWSYSTTLKVNGEEYEATAGTYSTINRRWKNGDVIELSLDMTPHFWKGAENRIGAVSIYTGPLLLAADTRFNDITQYVGPVEDIRLSLSGMTLTKVESDIVPSYPEPIVLYSMRSGDGKNVVLCDFATAGMAGTKYTTWIPVYDTDMIVDGIAVWTGR